MQSSCPRCGAVVATDAAWCRRCGLELGANPAVAPVAQPSAPQWAAASATPSPTAIDAMQSKVSARWRSLSRRGKIGTATGVAVVAILVLAVIGGGSSKNGGASAATSGASAGRPTAALPSDTVAPSATVSIAPTAGPSVTTTPTEAPTVVATDTPSPTETTTGGSLTVTITGLRTTVTRGSNATLSAHTSPGAVCAPTITYASGNSSTAAGLGTKSASSNGNVTWTWKVGSNTGPGVSTGRRLGCGSRTPTTRRRLPRSIRRHVPPAVAAPSATLLPWCFRPLVSRPGRC
jgi:hypothetical protein